MSSLIHPMAVVDSNAKIGNNVKIGAFSLIGPNVEIDDDCEIASHVVIEGHTKIGKNNQFSQFSSIGALPQHKKYHGEPTLTLIGDNNIFREYVSIHRGTMIDRGVTQIGSNNYLMAYVHIAHDCTVGNEVTMANGASLAGHARVDDACILGGFALVYQFTRIGAYAYIGFGSGVNHDVLPALMVNGYPAHPHGLNSEGLRRRGFMPEDIAAFKKAYKLFYKNNLLLTEAQAEIEQLSQAFPKLKLWTDFMTETKRNYLR